MRIDQLRVRIHRIQLNYRRIDVMISSPQVTRLWKDSTTAQQDKLVELVEEGDEYRIRRWIRQHPSLELGELSSVQLKEFARDLGIKNYSRMVKVELIKAIENQKKENSYEKV